MAAVDLEFPFADSQVGLSFPAGGEYDPAKTDEKERAATQIKCTISGTGLAEVSSSIFMVGTVMTPWSVSFVLPGPGPYAGCTLKAFLGDGTNWIQQDSVANIQVSSPAQPGGGGGVIITLPACPP